MFSLWLWMRNGIPTTLHRFRPSFNFITLHYCYIIGWTLVGAIILYGAGGHIAFIDALFFASGSATQSGLNTIDVNKMELYQQVTIMIMTCLCTPMFIHGSVVFIRLYWFEKRFQHVVIEARSRGGRTRTLSRRKSDATIEMNRDREHEERAIENRDIHVVRTANGHAKGGKIEDEHAMQSESDGTGIGKPSSSDEGDRTDRSNTPTHQVTSNIIWADNFNSPKQPDRERPDEIIESPMDRMPQMDKEKSIAFVESQRNESEKPKLRIPGPRDFDKGHVPEKVDENDDDGHMETPIDRVSHEFYTGRDRSNSVPNAMNGDDRPFKNHITIDVPDRPRPATGVSVYNRMKPMDTEVSTTPASPGARLRSTSRSRTFASFLSRNKDEDEDPMPYLSWTATIARNSNFVDLTEEQREELGGIEYRALKLLALILVCYFVGFHLLGMVCLLPWITYDARFRAVVEADNVNPKWWGIFTPASMFNDLGFTLTPDSMISFQFAVFPLLLGTFLIVIGNTGLPCMLRFIIWLCSQFVPRTSGIWEELRFLLDHPRRCFTLLFPSKANWWLFWVLILLNGVDLIFFIILDLNDPTVTSLPGGYRFLSGLFQAASTRTAGFAVVNIADLHPAIQVSYLIMMYISIFPIAMSMRQTNVYEEKSLGVWADDDDEHSSYLSHHLRLQLSFDLWFVFLGFFLIAIIEGARLQNTQDIAFSLFAVLFEIVSAYGTVGLSLGYPNSNASFSAQFRTLSKLIIIAMQIRGRHRGLPYALDRAILLPSESLHAKENEDATRRARRGSTAQSIGSEGLQRTATGLSRRSSISGEQGRYTVADRFKPKQLKRILSGAFSNGPPVPHHEKRA